MTRQERRAQERAARRWLAAVQRMDGLDDDVKAFAPIVAATAVATGGRFTEDDLVATALARAEA